MNEELNLFRWNARGLAQIVPVSRTSRWIAGEKAGPHVNDVPEHTEEEAPVSPLKPSCEGVGTREPLQLRREG